MSRQRLILFVLLILLLLAMAWSYYSYPRAKTVSHLKYPPGSHIIAEKKRVSAMSPQASPSEGSVLRLDLLNREQSTFKGYRRNIFKPVFVDELKRMKQMASALKPVLPPVQPQKAAPAPPIVPAFAVPETPQRELASFTFLGFLKKDNRKTIFLAKDKDIILVKKGDTFAGRYMAASLTDNALTISVTDTGEEIVIPLIESKALSAAQQPKAFPHVPSH
jgi:hypothetical protein